MKTKTFFIMTLILLLISGYVFTKTYFFTNSHNTSQSIFLHKNIELGKVKADSLYPIVFKFKAPESLQSSYNLSFEPSCGCTILSGNKTKTIMPNKLDSVNVILNTQGKKGYFTVNISVLDSNYQIVDSLKISGYAE